MNSVHVSLFLVCEKYLHQFPEDADLLWEVENTGNPTQRTNIASKIRVMDLSGEILPSAQFWINEKHQMFPQCVNVF